MSRICLSLYLLSFYLLFGHEQTLAQAPKELLPVTLANSIELQLPAWWLVVENGRPGKPLNSFIAHHAQAPGSMDSKISLQLNAADGSFIAAVDMAPESKYNDKNFWQYTQTQLQQASALQLRWINEYYTSVWEENNDDHAMSHWQGITRRQLANLTFLRSGYDLPASNNRIYEVHLLNQHNSMQLIFTYNLKYAADIEPLIEAIIGSIKLPPVRQDVIVDVTPASTIMDYALYGGVNLSLPTDWRIVDASPYDNNFQARLMDKAGDIVAEVSLVYGSAQAFYLPDEAEKFTFYSNLMRAWSDNKDRWAPRIYTMNNCSTRAWQNDIKPGFDNASSFIETCGGKEYRVIVLQHFDSSAGNACTADNNSFIFIAKFLLNHASQMEPVIDAIINSFKINL